MLKAIQSYIDYLHDVKHVAGNTEISYERDLKKAAGYFTDLGKTGPETITAADLKTYIETLKQANMSAATVSRNVAALRSFFKYLAAAGRIAEDPSGGLKPPKVEKKDPEVLTVEEVELLLDQPDEQSAKGIRDRAMLELLYATGIRVSELIHLKLEDVDVRRGLLSCREDEKERIVPFGETTKAALKSYLSGAREQFVQDRESDYLFTNYSGGTMSRQGFWKLLKAYAQSAGITKDITPHTMRHSFTAHMMNGGADAATVQAMLGNAEGSSSTVYAGMNTRTIKKLYAKSHPRK